MTIQLSAEQLKSLRDEARQAGVLRQYTARLKAGESPRMALMLAVQSFPGVNGTDAKFNRLERECMSSNYTADDRERIVKIAKKAGINTTGRTYNGQLGKYNDPRAWVSGTHDVRQSAKVKGLSIRGQVNAENEPIPRKKKRLSDQLIRDTEQAYLKENPALAETVKRKPKARKELRERIVATHAIKR